MWDSVYDAVSLTVKAVRELKLQIQSHSTQLGGDNCFTGERWISLYHTSKNNSCNLVSELHTGWLHVMIWAKQMFFLKMYQMKLFSRTKSNKLHVIKKYASYIL